MADVLANGVRLHYEERGRGPETVVFSHSYMASSAHFAPQLGHLSARYRCLAYDHRGHGASELARGGYDMESIYGDAVAFIEATGAAPCHFVGLSTGGFVGLRLGIRRPDLLRSLVLMDTSAEVEPGRALRRFRLMLAVVGAFGTRPVVDRVLPFFFARSFLEDRARAAELSAFRALLLRNDAAAMVRFGKGIFARESVHAELGRIRTPTLVVVGSEDLATPVSRARRIAEGVPGARLVVVEGAGHLCTLEKPGAVNEAIDGFLASLG